MTCFHILKGISCFLEALEGKNHFDKVEIYGILARLLDSSCWSEFKAFYGPGLVAGTGYIEG